ncbi:hypothetical protein AVEN_188592-1, partial [Araneus ventricosus]
MRVCLLPTKQSWASMFSRGELSFRDFSTTAFDASTPGLGRLSSLISPSPLLYVIARWIIDE